MSQDPVCLLVRGFSARAALVARPTPRHPPLKRGSTAENTDYAATLSQHTALAPFAAHVERELVQRFGARETERVRQSWRLADAGYVHFDQIVPGHEYMKQEARSYVPGLNPVAFWDTSSMAWARTLEESWEVVRDEFERVALQDAKRTTRVPRAVAAPAAAPAAAPVAAPAAAPADAFAVGATVELHGLVSNPAANGRRVVVVQTPPDVAERGRISVNLDGAVRAVKRENVRAVPGGVGAAPSTAAMAWLTPGFLSIRLSVGSVGRVAWHLSMGIGRTSRAAPEVPFPG